MSPAPTSLVSPATSALTEPSTNVSTWSLCSCTSAPMSSPGLSVITTSWVCPVVCRTRRNASLSRAAAAMSTAYMYPLLPKPSVPVEPGDLLVRRDVPGPRLVDHVRRDLRAGCDLVPLLRRRPVPQVLLGHADLAAARPPVVDPPIARPVRRTDLVGDDHLTVRAEPELELGVGEDHTALLGDLGGPRVQRERGIEQLGRIGGADQPGHLVVRDRLVVP